MNATNTLSIKSPVVWQASLRPSKLFAVLYFLSLLLALVALWQCPLHWGTRLLLLLITFIGGTKIYLFSPQCESIALCEDDSWLLIENSHQFAGPLCSGCYRSILLVVLAIKPMHGLPQYAVIWRDSLPVKDFSALHIKLALTPAHHLH